jgi:hypothetical protein
MRLGDKSQSQRGYRPGAASAASVSTAATNAANATNLTTGAVPHARIDSGQVVTGVVSGVASAGAITLAGAKVGDKVVRAVNLTDSSDARSSFEATITSAGHIQQSSGSDLSAKKFDIELLSQS